MSFAEKKYVSILTETHINQDQMQHQIHTRNIWSGPISFSPRDSLTKGSFVLLEGITEVDTDPKGGLVSFKVTPLPRMKEFSVFMPLQSIAPGNS